MFIPAISNRAAGRVRNGEGIYPMNGNALFFARLSAEIGYEPSFGLQIESRSNSFGGAFGAWQASSFGVVGDPSALFSSTSEAAVEFRFRHQVPLITQYLRIDWDEIEAEVYDLSPPSASYRPYGLARLEFRPAHYEFGAATSGTVGRFSKHLPAFGGAGNNAFNRGVTIDANGNFIADPGFRLEWANSPSAVEIGPFNNSQLRVGAGGRFWWTTWARPDLAYAELVGESPTQVPALRFQPFFFEARSEDYDWYWKQFPGVTGMKMIRGWIPMDDTSGVVRVTNAFLRDPLDGSPVYCLPILRGGAITSITGATTAPPFSMFDPSPNPGVQHGAPWASVGINGTAGGSIFAFSARGIPAEGDGIRSIVRKEYVWDGTVPEGYNPFVSSTWPVSPTYTLPRITEGTSTAPGRAINMPFCYLRAADQAVGVDI